MDTDLQVEVNELRRCGSGVTRTADQIATGPASAPPLAVAAPGWSAAAALAAMEQAAARHLGDLADRIATTGRRLGTAAEEYDNADARAAHRLRLG